MGMSLVSKKTNLVARSQNTKKPRHRKKWVQRKPKGIVFIQSTQNNTIVTLTDLKGNTKSWASGGSCGFNGSRRSTTYAAKAAAQKVAKDALSMGFKHIRVKIQGLRRGKKKKCRKRPYRFKNCANSRYNE